MSDDEQPIRKRFMTFDEGFALYLGYMTNSVKTDLLDRDKKKRFRELLCHEKYGLSVYMMNGFIVIKPNNFDLHYFACAMMSKMQSEQITVERTNYRNLRTNYRNLRDLNYRLTLNLLLKMKQVWFETYH